MITLCEKENFDNGIKIVYFIHPKDINWTHRRQHHAASWSLFDRTSGK